ncbi:MAG: DNA repair protein RecN [Calditrichaceae bacterium]
MVKNLYIKNFALVDETEVTFKPGLNIITGETGAGKSILVNALGQLCGDRSSSDLIRSGEKKAIIEAEIDIGSAANFLDLTGDFDPDNNHRSTIILRKEINANGSARIFLNDTPITLNKLNELSSRLIDLHGQHQHQRLLHPENHIVYLDDFGGLEPMLRTFQDYLHEYKKAVTERDDLTAKKASSVQIQDMYRYQLDELRKAELDGDEIENLRTELKILSHVEDLHQYGSVVTETLYDGDRNAGHLIVQAEENLKKIAKLDPQFENILESLTNARIAIEDIGSFSAQYIAGLEFDPDRAEFIRQRIAQLEFLLKKYGKINVQDLLEHREEIAKLLNNMDHFDEELAECERKILKLKEVLIEKGLGISNARKLKSANLENQITGILTEIGMPQARFRVHQVFHEHLEGQFIVEGKRVVLNSRGFDQVLFEIASNAGEDFKPLHKIASGGEISRIMLALKTILAEMDQLPILIFDEIDNGISGKIAQIVGKKMSELAKYHQILCVTHLPQIAAFADSHYKVAKSVEDNRTFVGISLLSEDNREKEIANLLGGEIISSHALENARHLIHEARNYK